MNARKIQRMLVDAGWRLVRITRRGHHVYKTPAGGLQVVNVHGKRNRDDYAHAYLSRDVRREQKTSADTGGTSPTNQQPEGE